MEMNEEDKKRQIEFVMKIGFQMKTFLNDCLVDYFKTDEERAAAFYSTLINFIANSIAEASAPDRLKDNVNEIIEGLQDWMNGKDILFVNYDPKTNQVYKDKKEDLH